MATAGGRRFDVQSRSRSRRAKAREEAFRSRTVPPTPPRRGHPPPYSWHLPAAAGGESEGQQPQRPRSGRRGAERDPSDERRWPLLTNFSPWATLSPMGKSSPLSEVVAARCPSELLVRLPFMIVRDGTDLGRPAALVDIGQEVVLALDLARCGRDLLGYGAGVNRAVDVLDKLAAMTWPSEVAALVRVAHARVVVNRPRREDERDAKRKAVAARGESWRTRSWWSCASPSWTSSSKTCASASGRGACGSWSRRADRRGRVSERRPGAAGKATQAAGRLAPGLDPDSELTRARPSCDAK